MLTLTASRFVSGVCIALPCLGLGEVDEALHWLGIGLDQRAAWSIYLLTEPRLNALHGDPRFERLLDRINLSQS